MFFVIFKSFPAEKTGLCSSTRNFGSQFIVLFFLTVIIGTIKKMKCQRPQKGGKGG